LVESDRRDYDVTAAVASGHRGVVPFDKLTGRAQLLKSDSLLQPEPGTYDPSYDAVLPHVPAASLALRGREESAGTGKRWEGNVLELNPDYDVVKPSAPSATISAFVLSAKTASGAVCCDDVPGVGTYDPQYFVVKQSVRVPVFRCPAVHQFQESFGNVYNPSFSLVERSVMTPKLHQAQVSDRG
jgi:hypothetical protein